MKHVKAPTGDAASAQSQAETIERLMQTSVILIDDHPLFRRGLSELIKHTPQLKIAGQFGDAKETREWLQSGERADVALLDRRLQDGDGLDLVPDLKQRDIKIVMLTIAEEDHEILDAIERGVDGYVLKTSESEQIIQAIIGVTQGSSTFPSDVMQKMARGELRHSLAEKLSPREFEIVCHVAMGLSNRGIGKSLGLSENTVRNHLRNILEKLGFDNRVQVATFALENGFLKKAERSKKT